MVLTGINSARRYAKSGKSATIRIRLSASGRTMNRSNSKDGRRRNSAETPIDRHRTNSGARMKISVAIATDRRKTNSEDKPKTSNEGTMKGRRKSSSVPSNVVNGTNSARRRSSGAGLISSVRTMTKKGDKQRSNDAVLTSSDGFKRTRTDAALIRSGRPRNNVATPNCSDAIRDRQIDGGLMMDAALIRSVKLKSN